MVDTVERSIPECPIHHIPMVPTDEYEPRELGQPGGAMRPILRCPELDCTERKMMDK